jgi:hypothetical protein
MPSASNYCEVDLQGAKVNYCPFGCGADDLDDYGHCRHLVGFTDSFVDSFKDGSGKVIAALRHVQLGATYEAIAPQVRTSFSTGQKFDTGYKTTFGGRKGTARQKVRVGDVIVNPQKWLEADQHQAIPAHWASKWLSARVYRATANTPLAYHQTDDDGLGDIPEGHREVLTVTAPEPIAPSDAAVLAGDLDKLGGAKAAPVAAVVHDDQPPAWARQLLDRVEQLGERLEDLENAQTAPAAVAGAPQSADDVPDDPENEE